MGENELSLASGSLDLSLLKELGELAGKELARRLKNPKLREEIPGTGLLNLALAAAKQAEQERKPEEKITATTDVLELIDKSSFTDEKKKELIDAEILKAEQRVIELQRRKEKELE